MLLIVIKLKKDCLFLTGTKIKKMYDTAADNYFHASKFIRDCYKTQKMCDKAANFYLSAIQLA